MHRDLFSTVYYHDMTTETRTAFCLLKNFWLHCLWGVSMCFSIPSGIEPAWGYLQLQTVSE